MKDFLLSYNDVVLIPKLGIIPSRKSIDTSVIFGNKRFNLPILPSNMFCTISFELANLMSENDYFYILHRFYDYEIIFNWIKNNQHLKTISISVGVKDDDYKLITKLSKEKLRVDYFSVDVAHGFSLNLKNMAATIKETFPNSFLIGGNVFGNSESINALQSWGCDAIKVGLSCGKSCSTYKKTGFASPMFSAGVQSSTYSNVPIILDGGIRTEGDVSKSLVAGATMVMVGSMFAACVDSPAKLINGKKMYYGSASKENGNDKNIEGFLIELECNGLTYIDRLKLFQQSLQSSISYAGGVNLSAFNSVKWMRIISQ
jgi:GMP reductase